MTLSKFTLKLDALRQQGLYRTHKVMETPQDVRLAIEGRIILNFCSNDYLGLANDEIVKTAFKAAIDQYGVGSGSAHLICGHNAAHDALEEALAAFTGRERALLFSTGYMANLGVIAALLGPGDCIFEDKLNHASLLDGGLASGATFKRYLHKDVQQLERIITEASGWRLIATDGVFSMDGDTAPLLELVSLAKRTNSCLMVDDAHGIGVLGQTGGGLLEQLQLTQTDVPILMGTFGKAFGTFGAFVAGSDTLIETLIQFARTYIYTTALPPAIAQATLTSLRILNEQTWRREKLEHLVCFLKKGAFDLGLPLMPSDTPIQPLFVGDSIKAVALSHQLWTAGFWVSAIRPPTVPKGKARLRITLSASHSEEDISRLLQTLDLLRDNF